MAENSDTVGLKSAYKYLDLVEEYPRDYEITQFEKVLVAAKRAKALHAGKDQLVVSDRNPPFVALEEFNGGAIQLVYRDEEPLNTNKHEGDDSEEEE